MNDFAGISFDNYETPEDPVHIVFDDNVGFQRLEDAMREVEEAVEAEQQKKDYYHGYIAKMPDYYGPGRYGWAFYIYGPVDYPGDEAEKTLKRVIHGLDGHYHATWDHYPTEDDQIAATPPMEWKRELEAQMALATEAAETKDEFTEPLLNVPGKLEVRVGTGYSTGLVGFLHNLADDHDKRHGHIGPSGFAEGLRYAANIMAARLVD